MVEAIWTDVRYAIRRVRHSSLSSTTLVLTLALTIGANITGFSLLDAAWLRTIGGVDANDLVAISVVDTATNQSGQIDADVFSAFQQQQQTFSMLTLYSSALLRVRARGASIDVAAEGVMPTYFDTLGVLPAAGRFFTASEGIANPSSVLVITDRLRRRLFGSTDAGIGETVTVEDMPVTIVGVTPSDFSGLQLDGGADLFLPLSLLRTVLGTANSPVRAPYIIARLAPGVRLEQARSVLHVQWRAIQIAIAPSRPIPATAKQQEVVLESLTHGFSGIRRQYGASVIILAGLTLVLLALGALDLMSVMFARAFARRHEIALCAALGANRGRVAQPMIIESALLALCGFVVALPLAWWSTSTLTTLLSFARGTPLQRPLTPDDRVLTAALLITLVMSILIGLFAAWRMVSRGLNDALRVGRTVTASVSWAERCILMTQIAMSVVFLVAAGLFAGMLSSLHANDARLRDQKIVWARLARTPTARRVPLEQSYFERLHQRLSVIPDVEVAAFSYMFPGALGFRGELASDTFSTTGTEGGAHAAALSEHVSPGFFEMFRIRRLAGRDFTWDDNASAPPVAIVTESLARQLFREIDAVGRRVRIVSGAKTIELEIVGVVENAPFGNLREPHVAVAFRPLLQDLTRAQAAIAHVRVHGDSTALRNAYVRAVEAEGQHFVRAVFRLDEWIDNALLQERLLAGVAISGAALVVLVACVGLYGLLAYGVVARVREIGIRMSLGATRRTILRMILGQSLKLVAPGVLIGVAIAAAAARLLRSQLYGISPTDPSTFIGSAILLTVVAVAAALNPAWRASRVRPIDAVRQE